MCKRILNSRNTTTATSPCGDVTLVSGVWRSTLPKNNTYKLYWKSSDRAHIIYNIRIHTIGARLTNAVDRCSDLTRMHEYHNMIRRSSVGLFCGHVIIVSLYYYHLFGRKREISSLTLGHTRVRRADAV